MGISIGLVGLGSFGSCFADDQSLLLTDYQEPWKRGDTYAEKDKQH
jgi:hypothetical protein